MNLLHFVGHLNTHALTRYPLIPRLAHVGANLIYDSVVSFFSKQFKDGDNRGWATPVKLCLLFSECHILILFFHLLLFSSTTSRLLLPTPSALQGVGMANKGPSYGLSRQVQDKIDSKYDPDLEQILVEWISRQCGSGVGRPESGKLGFQAWLKDGCVRVTHLPCYPLTLCAFRLLNLSCPPPCPGPRFWANLSTVCMQETNQWRRSRAQAWPSNRWSRSPSSSPPPRATGSPRLICSKLWTFGKVGVGFF